MIPNLFLILGILILSLGLRSFQHPIIKKIGALGILATSFLIGWLLVHSLILGIFLAVAWFFLPWIEILTRIRHLRMPITQNFKAQPPPRGPLFTSFEEVSDEIENHHFTHVVDTGWNWNDHRQFYRIFYKQPSKTSASICVTRQANVAFYYICLQSRDAQGRVFLTWNCPFSFGLKLSPNCRLNIIPEADLDILESNHEKFLKKNGVTPIALNKDDPEAMTKTIQEDARLQILYNIKLGLLKRDGDEHFRYSVRGMFFLWIQAIKEMIRIS